MAGVAVGSVNCTIAADKHPGRFLVDVVSALMQATQPAISDRRMEEGLCLSLLGRQMARA
jgi:hypothetical protein